MWTCASLVPSAASPIFSRLAQTRRTDGVASLARCSHARCRSARHVGCAYRRLHQLTPHAQADHRCLLLYLHVITYNDAALAFYARHGFQMLRRENQFYVIRQEHYDAFALGVYLNDGSAPSTASTAVSALHAAAAAALRWFVNNCTAARRPVCALPARGNDKSDA